MDPKAMTCAHRSITLLKWIRVRNTTNGRSLKLLVNDRGPFAKGRILDVSKRAAELLGFKDAGWTTLELEVIG